MTQASPGLLRPNRGGQVPRASGVCRQLCAASSTTRANPHGRVRRVAQLERAAGGGASHSGGRLGPLQVRLHPSVL